MGNTLDREKKYPDTEAILNMASGPPKFTRKVFKLKGYGKYDKRLMAWHKELTNYIPEPGLDSWLYYNEWPDNPAEEDTWQ
jgi:hypothetical protein